jgi:hypothetical protein
MESTDTDACKQDSVTTKWILLDLGQCKEKTDRRKLESNWNKENIQAFAAHDWTVSSITVPHILLNHKWDP